MKDPILSSYTFEELVYEYYDHRERDAAIEEQREEETDKIEDAKLDEALKWAEEEEAKEARLVAQPPTITDEAWMEKQLAAEKEKHGETFGEDIAEEF